MNPQILNRTEIRIANERSEGESKNKREGFIVAKA
jgi:hypothetical protein